VIRGTEIKQAKQAACRLCDQPVERPGGRGRPPEYCSNECRTEARYRSRYAYEMRRAADFWRAQNDPDAARYFLDYARDRLAEWDQRWREQRGDL
jgi:hypothetical protein